MANLPPIAKNLTIARTNLILDVLGAQGKQTSTLEEIVADLTLDEFLDLEFREVRVKES
jgi:hypothetical protein